VYEPEKEHLNVDPLSQVERDISAADKGKKKKE